jgi:hypothetical protein
MFAGLPMLAVPVIVYNLLAFVGDANIRSHSLPGRLNEAAGLVRMSSGAAWSPTLSDLILALAIGAVFVDLVKVFTNRKEVATGHIWSGLLLAICSIEFLLLPDFATSTFALITLMALFSSASALMITALYGWTSVDQRFRSGR